MIGDGINDAPAMASADVSISFNNASNLAIDTADIIIMENQSTNKIELTHKICTKTYITIKQNLTVLELSKLNTKNLSRN